MTSPARKMLFLTIFMIISVIFLAFLLQAAPVVGIIIVVIIVVFALSSILIFIDGPQTKGIKGIGDGVRIAGGKVSMKTTKRFDSLSNSYREYKSRNTFSIIFSNFTIECEPIKRGKDLSRDHLQLYTILPLDLPDFEINKSSNISEIMFSSDLLPAELSNVNVRSSNLTEASMWFNISPVIKFFHFITPLKSKDSFIRSSGDTIEMNVFVKFDLESLKSATYQIREFYLQLKNLLGDQSRRSEVRITRSTLQLHCKSCGMSIAFADTKCPSCGIGTANCVVCYQQLTEKSSAIDCCGSFIHDKHLENLGSTCPYCRQEKYSAIELIV